LGFADGFKSLLLHHLFAGNSKLFSSDHPSVGQLSRFFGHDGSILAFPAAEALGADSLSNRRDRSTPATSMWLL
jgi:hypothetical protein